jgi:hypothetical protein
MRTRHLKDTPEMQEWDASHGTLMELVEGATTQFWGGPVEGPRAREYSEGKLCRMCLLEDPPVFKHITNDAHLCVPHSREVVALKEKQMKIFNRRHAERLQERVDAIARDIVPAMARIEER